MPSPVKNDLARAVQEPSTVERDIIRYEMARKIRVSFTAVKMIGTIMYWCARPSVQSRVYGICSIRTGQTNLSSQEGLQRYTHLSLSPA
jgi:hypothetical protein